MLSIFNSKGGFETPLASKEEDALDRWRIARRIFDTIANAPLDWSMRIGVLGGWGEGKTTVMRFVDSLASEAGHFRVWYSPWAASTMAGLRFGFANEITRQLKQQNAPPKAISLMQAKLTGKKLARGAGAILSAIPKVKELRELAEMSFDWITEIPRDLLVKLAEQLGEKRIIVFIDDLDRTDPTLLPQLLLSLREVLDIPKFVFALSFDEQVVARSLENYNSAWGSGAKFLEKILDFRFPLPATTPEQQLGLVLSQAKKYSSFVPQSECRG